MALKQRGFWLVGFFFSLTFMVLFLVRLEVFKYGSTKGSASVGHGAVEVKPFETFLTILQNKNKIGFSRRVVKRIASGYSVVEETVMKLNTMGMVNDLVVTSESEAEPDFSLRSFDFKVESGRFVFRMTGTVEGSILSIKTWDDKGDHLPPINIEFGNRPYLASCLVQGMVKLDLLDEEVVFMFDPISMAVLPVTVRVISNELLEVMGEKLMVKKLFLEFKGMTLYAWMDDRGRVVKEEGILGMTLMATSRKEAMEGIRGGDDLTLVSSIKPNRIIDHPEELTKLGVVISGTDGGKLDPGKLDLGGGRQSITPKGLTITKENLLFLDDNPHGVKDVDSSFLGPDLFIQSDNPGIVSLAARIVNPGASSLEKIRAVLAWIKKNIEKRPTLSLPDALSTLKNRMGDCNEHAVLFAAFCRALKIPARVEAGLVYLNHRFYYHAWNGVYLGRWITVDPLFNQIPADVTHIRLVSGAGVRELDLAGLINRIKLEIVEEVR